MLADECGALVCSQPDDCGGYGGCQGSTCEIAYENVVQNGIASEQQWPVSFAACCYSRAFAVHDDSRRVLAGCGQERDHQRLHRVACVRFPSWLCSRVCSNNYTALMNAVANIGPVAVNVDSTGWSSYSHGIFSGCATTNIDINHGVKFLHLIELRFWLCSCASCRLRRREWRSVLAGIWPCCTLSADVLCECSFATRGAAGGAKVATVCCVVRFCLMP